jgi:hypothetical protein
MTSWRKRTNREMVTETRQRDKAMVSLAGELA